MPRLCGIRSETLSGTSVSLEEGVDLISGASAELRAVRNIPELTELGDKLSAIATRLRKLLKPPKVETENLRKDASLHLMAERGFNVAQFISYAPEKGKPRQTFARLAGRQPNLDFKNVRAGLEKLLISSGDHSINVRSFHPQNARSREFIYGLKSVDAAAAVVERLSAEGLHTIANETIDINDGGVSGVLMGNILEFAPDDTPRCVEKPGTASLPRGWGQELLSTVYGFSVSLPVEHASRVEFSLHPRPCGWLKTNILVWEYAGRSSVRGSPQLVWPNRFSNLVGDKAFGLLVAHHLGLPVPFTTVISRRIAPFSFGRPTGWNEHWIRTAPPEKAPGVFTTHRGWRDPFALLQKEDPSGSSIRSVLSQTGVNPVYSGALIVGASGDAIIEGRRGTGDVLMLGEAPPEAVPETIIHDVQALFERARAALGPVRLEWVHDGKQAWLVQLNRGATQTDGTNLTSADADNWIEFEVAKGVPALRALLDNLLPGTGVILRGRVGLTSYLAETICEAGVPGKIIG